MSKQAANQIGGRSMGVSGFDDLYKALGDLGEAAASKRTATAAVRDGTRVLADGVQGAAPVGTRPTRKYWKTRAGETRSADYGRLRDNIVIRKAKPLKKTYTGYNITTGDAFWGVFQEFGTINMAAHPWMRAAIDAFKHAAIERVAESLRARISKIKAKRAKG